MGEEEEEEQGKGKGEESGTTTLDRRHLAFTCPLLKNIHGSSIYLTIASTSGFYYFAITNFVIKSSHMQIKIARILCEGLLN